MHKFYENYVPFFVKGKPLEMRITQVCMMKVF